MNWSQLAARNDYDTVEVEVEVRLFMGRKAQSNPIPDVGEWVDGQ
jgi:hypothetical protein